MADTAASDLEKKAPSSTEVDLTKYKVGGSDNLGFMI